MNARHDPIAQLFLLMHGMYGNGWLDKWTTGKQDKAGHDLGVVSAQAIWRNRLAEFEESTIVAAARACEQRHRTFPPSLPEFVELCRAHRPRPVAAPPSQQLTMDPELRSAYVQDAKDQLAKMRAARAGDMPHIASGLSGLRALISKAHGLAGGDEVGMLHALELGQKSPGQRPW